MPDVTALDRLARRTYDLDVQAALREIARLKAALARARAAVRLLRLKP